MFDLDIYATGLAAVLVIAIAAWLVSIPVRNVSIVDSLWPLFFLVMTLVYVTFAPVLAARAVIVVFVVTVWATRLSVFITLRNRGAPEDRRYQRLRRDNAPDFWLKSLYLVFSLQAILAWIISLPLLAAILGTSPLGWLDYAAVTLWLTGFGIEAIADQQLAAFNARPGNQDQVLDRGLWRYTRHPNYFGEFCIWWGFYLLALSAGAWWSLIGPLLVSILLVRVAGIGLLERDIGERRPAYHDYIRRTNTFFPGPPRDASAAQVQRPRGSA
jgi:steroid 5-alpha reductase family enzyme